MLDILGELESELWFGTAVLALGFVLLCIGWRSIWQSYRKIPMGHITILLVLCGFILAVLMFSVILRQGVLRAKARLSLRELVAEMATKEYKVAFDGKDMSHPEPLVTQVIKVYGSTGTKSGPSPPHHTLRIASDTISVDLILAPDSQRENEYWVFWPTRLGGPRRGLEVGRIKCDEASLTNQGTN